MLLDFGSTPTGPPSVFLWKEAFVLAEFTLKEMALGFTSDIAKNNLGESFYRPWVPFITTIFLFIFVSNWSGALIPWKLFEIPAELAAPTNNINTTVALSLRQPYVHPSFGSPKLLTSLAYFGGGLAKKGLGYFARYAPCLCVLNVKVKPTPILLPINILEDFTKPLSLSFRLFGNVVADELTVGVAISVHSWSRHKPTLNNKFFEKIRL
eukprot:Skav226187  [mRNA]  locus=scaffold2212:79646:80849:+ [translate_table: standard]